MTEADPRFPNPWFRLVLGLVALLFAATAEAQEPFDGADPLGEGRMILDSDELVLLYGNGSTSTYQAIFDATVPIDDADLTHTGTNGIGSVHAGNKGLALATGDFDGDGEQEWISLWETSGLDITFSFPTIDRDNAITTGSTEVTVSAALNSTAFAGALGLGDLRVLRLDAADLDGDGDDELILAYRRGDHALRVNVYHPTASGLGTNVRTLTLTGANAACTLQTFGAGPVFGTGAFDVATGDVDQDGVEEIIVLDIDYSFCINVPSGSGLETQFTHQPRLRVFDYDPAAGLALAATTSLQNPLNALSLSSARWSGTQYYRVELAVGDLTGNGADEVVAAVVTAIAPFTAQFQIQPLSQVVSYAISGSDFVGTPGPPDFLAPLSVNFFPTPLSLEIEDLDRDGQAEVVSHTEALLQVWRAEDGANLDLLVSADLNSSISGLQSHSTLAIGDLDAHNNDVFAAEIAVIDRIGVAGGSVLRIFRLEGDNVLGHDLAELTSQSTPIFENSPSVAIGMSNVDGDGARLGTPSMVSRSDVLQPLVLLNAPPVHFDAFDRVPEDGSCFDGSFDIDPSCYDVNLCFPTAADSCQSSSEYQKSQSVDIQSDVTATWATSRTTTRQGQVAVTTPYVSGSVGRALTRSVGRNFSNTTGQGQSITVTSTSLAVRDDRLYATVSNYDVFEYPVFTDLPDPIGHVVAVVPTFVSPTWIRSKSSFDIQTLPDHEFGNLLSYKDIQSGPTADLSDVDAAAESIFIEGDSRDVTPSGGDSWDVLFSQFSSESTTFGSSQQVSRRRTAEVSGRLAIVSASLSTDTEGTYGSSDISTHQTSIATTGGIHVEFGRVDDTLQFNGAPAGSPDYFVRPYVYWNREGAMVVDFAVRFVGAFWDNVYGQKPDLTVIQPYRHDQAKGIASTPFDEHNRTRDIVINPRNPRFGDIADLHVRVQNYSLLGSGASAVDLYLDDPSAGGVLIGSAPIPALGPRESTVATVTDWIVPAGLTSESRIYAVIDPGDLNDEIHENNNIAWISAGAVPEPSAGVASAAALVALLVCRRLRGQFRG